MNAANNETAVAIYKAMEELIQQFGSERQAVAVIGKILKDTKRTANEKRHIRRKGQAELKAPVPLVQSAAQVIRNYERHILEKEKKKKES